MSYSYNKETKCPTAKIFCFLALKNTISRKKTVSSNKIFLVVSRKFEKFTTVHCMFFVVEQFTNFFCMIQSNVIDWWSIQKRPVGDILSLCTRACHLKWTKRSFFLPPFSSLFFPKAVLLVLSFPFVRTRPASFAKKDLSWLHTRGSTCLVCRQSSSVIKLNNPH